MVVPHLLKSLKTVVKFRDNKIMLDKFKEPMAQELYRSKLI